MKQNFPDNLIWLLCLLYTSAVTCSFVPLPDSEILVEVSHFLEDAFLSKTNEVLIGSAGHPVISFEDTKILDDEYVRIFESIDDVAKRLWASKKSFTDNYLKFISDIMVNRMMNDLMILLVEREHPECLNEHVCREYVKDFWFRSKTNMLKRTAQKLMNSLNLLYEFHGPSAFTRLMMGFDTGSPPVINNWIGLMLRINDASIKVYSARRIPGTQVPIARFSYGLSSGSERVKKLMFVGTDPRFEIAVYTLCFMMKRDQPCTIFQGSKVVTINLDLDDDLQAIRDITVTVSEDGEHQETQSGDEGGRHDSELDQDDEWESDGYGGGGSYAEGEFGVETVGGYERGHYSDDDRSPDEDENLSDLDSPTHSSHRNHQDNSIASDSVRAPKKVISAPPSPPRKLTPSSPPPPPPSKPTPSSPPPPPPSKSTSSSPPPSPPSKILSSPPSLPRKRTPSSPPPPPPQKLTPSSPPPPQKFTPSSPLPTPTSAPSSPGRKRMAPSPPSPQKVNPPSPRPTNSFSSPSKHVEASIFSSSKRVNSDSGSSLIKKPSLRPVNQRSPVSNEDVARSPLATSQINGAKPSGLVKNPSSPHFSTIKRVPSSASRADKTSLPLYRQSVSPTEDSEHNNSPENVLQSPESAKFSGLPKYVPPVSKLTAKVGSSWQKADITPPPLKPSENTEYVYKFPILGSIEDQTLPPLVKAPIETKSISAKTDSSVSRFKSESSAADTSPKQRYVSSATISVSKAPISNPVTPSGTKKTFSSNMVTLSSKGSLPTSNEDRTVGKIKITTSNGLKKSNSIYSKNPGASSAHQSPLIAQKSNRLKNSGSSDERNSDEWE